MQNENQREICYKCYRPKTSCICEHVINPIKTNTKFVILMHPKEYRKTKNGTGHMTNNSLENCELHVGIDFSNHTFYQADKSDTKYYLSYIKKVEKLRKKGIHYSLKIKHDFNKLSTFQVE